MQKSDRKTFIKQSAALAVTSLVSGKLAFAEKSESPLAEIRADKVNPVVVSTWNHGIPANKEAWKYLHRGQSSLDAVEAGVRIPESDPGITSVGYGGYPDAEGKVTLDSCIMDSDGNCGAVSFLEHIKNPISVARKVMEQTEHVMLSGEGALDFALKQGFEKEDILSPGAKAAYEKWLNTSKKEEIKEKVDMHNHDTIGMLALDKNGKLAGACTTSGLAWKMRGRVGDSPIIGAGLFVDGEIGAATATGKGESVIKIAGTAVIVELMRQGKNPQEACEIVVKRIADKQKDYAKFQVGFLAMNLNGDIGAYALHKGFQYALCVKGKNKLFDSDYLD